jgi:hypothetical protein
MEEQTRLPAMRIRDPEEQDRRKMVDLDGHVQLDGEPVEAVCQVLRLPIDSLLQRDALLLESGQGCMSGGDGERVAHEGTREERPSFGGL